MVLDIWDPATILKIVLLGWYHNQYKMYTLKQNFLQHESYIIILCKFIQGMVTWTSFNFNLTLIYFQTVIEFPNRKQMNYNW